MIYRIRFILLMVFFSHPLFATINYQHVSDNKKVQTLFNSGMLNYYAYSYTQAENDFRQALLYDQNCGMCYWGLALAKKHQALELGHPFKDIGYEDIQRAAKLVNQKNTFHYDAVQAARRSFSLDKRMTSRKLQVKYINSLKTLYQKYKHNPEWREESLALLVDAIVYFDNVDHSQEGDVILSHCHASNDDYKHEALELLVPVLKNPAYPDHPGLLHSYIHIAERHTSDPIGLVAAKKLPAFSDGLIAHYIHMPNHIYWRRGMYDEAIQANRKAIEVDTNYFKQGGAGLNSYYYEYHFLHSHHFLTALGILTNNYNMAAKYSRMIKRLMDVSRMSNLIDYRDIFLSLEHIVLARFKRWEEVLQLPVPAGTNQLGKLFIHFTQSLAYLHLGQDDKFKQLYLQIKEHKYTKGNIQDIQILVLSYLKASQLSKQQAPFSDIERVFLNNQVGDIEEKLFVRNPPIWYFPYSLFLSNVAESRSDDKNKQKYRKMFEKMYPKSTLR